MARFTDERAGESNAALAAHVAQFSLLRGGPYYRLQRALHSARRDAPRPGAEAAALVALTWLPLAVLAAVQGLAVRVPAGGAFVTDFATHARCLVAIPLLVAAERLVDTHFAASVRGIVDAGLIRPEQHGAFERAMATAERRRDSRVAQLVLLALSYAGSCASMLVFASVEHGTRWTAAPVGSTALLSLAGWWQLAVSLPVFQFLLLLWLWRWTIWSLFLWRVSRLDLNLIATHPDHAAGLRQLADPVIAFALVVFAGASVLSGAWLHLVLYEHTRATALEPSIVAFAVLALLATLGPLLAFTPRLYATRQRDVVRYSSLVHQYLRYFDRRWVGHSGPRSDETLEDIHADTLTHLSESQDAVRRTRLAPFGKQSILATLAAALVPMAPLALTVVPLADVGEKLLHIVA